MLSIDSSIFKGKKLMIATPMYGGQCFGLYTKSIVELYKIAREVNLDLQFEYLYNESLINRARNRLAHTFLKSECDFLIFIDSDIEFNPLDLLAMLQYSILDTKYSIIAGTYPIKQLNWDAIKEKIANKTIEDIEDIEFFASIYTAQFLNGISDTEIYLDRPAKVSEISGGFMLIDKKVFKALLDKQLAKPYVADGSNHTEHAFFDCVINPIDGRYLSEDYSFCKLVRDAGFDVWLAPWVNLNHMGTHKFVGNFFKSSIEFNK